MLFITLLEVVASAIRKGKKNAEIEKEEIKLFLFEGDMTVYIKSLKESTISKKKLEVMS